MKHEVLISGVQPTGKLHIGNYLGAIKNFVDLQNSDKYKCYFFIADLHSLSGKFSAESSHKQILDLLANYIAAGLKFNKSTIFQQSQIPYHAELALIFNSIVPIGDLERMTQFKDKARVDPQGLIDNIEERYGTMKADLGKVTHVKGTERQIQAPVDLIIKMLKLYQETTDLLQSLDSRRRASAGLLTYPTLMAADILLYSPRFVPVGNDQLQHLELTRTIVRKFNRLFGATFAEPVQLLTNTPRIMNLKHPTRKMSKSEPEGCLFLDDTPDVIKAKIAGATTDSEGIIAYDPQRKPGLSNLLEIYAALTDMEVRRLAIQLHGERYSTLKKDLTEITIEYFAEFRKRKELALSNKVKLLKNLNAGTREAAKVAEKKMEQVKERLGLSQG